MALLLAQVTGEDTVAEGVPSSATGKQRDVDGVIRLLDGGVALSGLKRDPLPTEGEHRGQAKPGAPARGHGHSTAAGQGAPEGLGLACTGAVLGSSSRTRPNAR